LACAQAGADSVMAMIAAKTTVMNFFILDLPAEFSLPNRGSETSVGGAN